MILFRAEKVTKKDRIKKKLSKIRFQKMLWGCLIGSGSGKAFSLERRRFKTTRGDVVNHVYI